MKLSILLPVRNDGINLKIMVKILEATVEVPHELVIVHDDKEDDSVEVVASFHGKFPHIRTVHNVSGRGVINAIKTGVEQSRGEYVLIFAADETGPVLAIDNMLHLMEQGCDFVSCTRYARGGRRLGGSIIGGILSRMANRLFYWFSFSGLTDATTGIKMFRKTAFQKMDLQSEPVGWAVAFELAIKAQLLKLKLGEVPIISIDRLYGGTSTFRVGPWVIVYLKWFLWGIRELRKATGGVRPEVMYSDSSSLSR